MKILTLNQFNEKIVFRKRKISDIKNLEESILDKLPLRKILKINSTNRYTLSYNEQLVFMHFINNNLKEYAIWLKDNTEYKNTISEFIDNIQEGIDCGTEEPYNLSIVEQTILFYFLNDNKKLIENFSHFYNDYEKCLKKLYSALSNWYASLNV